MHMFGIVEWVWQPESNGARGLPSCTLFHPPSDTPPVD